MTGWDLILGVFCGIGFILGVYIGIRAGSRAFYLSKSEFLHREKYLNKRAQNKEDE